MMKERKHQTYSYAERKRRSMHRLLIVDDSYDQKEVIKFFVAQRDEKWLIHEAKHGREGWTLFQKEPYDLVITDVKMPFMDGHELAHLIKSNKPETPLLFISGYEDFHFVKKALQLQAVDYLLKPLDPDTFKAQIDKMLAIVQTLKYQRNQKIVHDRRYLKETLTKLFLGLPWEDLSTEEQSIAQFYLKENDCFTVLPLPKDSQNQVHFLHSLIHERPDVCFLPIHNAHLIFFDSAHTIKESRLRKTIRDLFLRHFLIQPTFMTSTSLRHPFAIYSIYQSLLASYTHSFYNNEKKQTCLLLPEHHYIVKTGIPLKISTYMQQGDITKITQLIQMVYASFEASSSEAPTTTKFYFATIYQTIVEHAKGLLDFTSLSPQINRILEADSLEKILVVFDELLHFLQENADFTVNDHPNGYIRQVKHFIFLNFHQELSLETLANEVNINPNYLSELFSKYEGMGLTKYIKAYRIMQAQKKLKNSSYSVQSISKQVGFNHYSYFCRTFREIVGMTPDAYRKKGL